MRRARYPSSKSLVLCATYNQTRGSALVGNLGSDQQDLDSFGQSRTVSHNDAGLLGRYLISQTSKELVGEIFEYLGWGHLFAEERCCEHINKCKLCRLQSQRTMFIACVLAWHDIHPEIGHPELRKPGKFESIRMR